jgi:hypothetical protein
MQSHVTHQQRFQWLPSCTGVSGRSPLHNKFLIPTLGLNPSLLSCAARAFRPSAAIFPHRVFRYRRYSSTCPHSLILHPTSGRGRIPRMALRQKLAPRREKRCTDLCTSRLKILDVAGTIIRRRWSSERHIAVQERKIDILRVHRSILLLRFTVFFFKSS